MSIERDTKCIFGMNLHSIVVCEGRLSSISGNTKYETEILPNIQTFLLAWRLSDFQSLKNQTLNGTA